MQTCSRHEAWDPYTPRGTNGKGRESHHRAGAAGALHPLLAKAWTKLCDKVDFYKVASKVGNNLAAQPRLPWLSCHGSRDNLVKIEGIGDTYSFKDDDAAWGTTKVHPHPTPEEGVGLGHGQDLRRAQRVELGGRLPRGRAL